MIKMNEKNNDVEKFIAINETQFFVEKSFENPIPIEVSHKSKR